MKKREVQCTGPARKLSYGTIFKTIDAEMNAVGLRKNHPYFFLYMKIWSCSENNNFDRAHL